MQVLETEIALPNGPLRISAMHATVHLKEARKVLRDHLTQPSASDRSLESNLNRSNPISVTRPLKIRKRNKRRSQINGDKNIPKYGK